MNDLNDRYDPTAFCSESLSGCRSGWTIKECMTRLEPTPRIRIFIHLES
ncbi:hypothetical protein [Stieleria marina]